MPNLRNSFVNNQLPLPTLQAKKDDAIVNAVGSVKAEDLKADLEGALQHTAPTDKIQIATKTTAEGGVELVEISREEAMSMIAELNQQIGKGYKLADVEIPPAADQPIKVSKEYDAIDQAIMDHLGHLGGKFIGGKEAAHGHQLGAAASDIQYIARNLREFIAGTDYKGKPLSASERAVALAKTFSYWNELKADLAQKKPPVHIGGPLDMLKKIPGAQDMMTKLAKTPVMKKLFADGIESERRLTQIGQLMDGKMKAQDARAIFELALDFKDDLAALKEYVPDKVFKMVSAVGSWMPPSLLKAAATAGEKSAYIQGALKIMASFDEKYTGSKVAMFSAGTAMIFAQASKDFAQTELANKLGLKNMAEAFVKGMEPFKHVLDDRMISHLGHLANSTSVGDLMAAAQQIGNHGTHLDNVHHHADHHGSGNTKGADSHHTANGPETKPIADAHPPAQHTDTPKPDPKATVEGPKPTVDVPKPPIVEPPVDPAVLKQQQISEFAEKMGLDSKQAETLTQATSKLDDAGMKKLFSEMEKAKSLGNKNLMHIVETFKNDPGMMSKAMTMMREMAQKFGNDAKKMAELLRFAGKEVIEQMVKYKNMALDALATVVKKTAPYLEKLGLNFSEVAPRIGKFLGPTMGKMVPAFGAGVAFYDAVRLGKIAADGSVNKDVRALAALGSALNTADGALGIAEAFGVGNIGLPANIAMALGEIAIDVAIDYYKENPAKMPQGVRTGIRTMAAVTAVAAPTIMAPVMYGIYKDDINAFVVETSKLIAKKGKEAIEALKYYGEAGLQKLQSLVESGEKWCGEAMESLRSVGRRGQELINQAVDRLAARPDGLGKLAKIYKEGGSKAVIDAIYNRLQRAWQESSFSNGYAGIRDLFGELTDQALALGGEAAEFAKKIIYEVGCRMDNAVDDWVPDMFYSWAKP